MIVTSTLIMCVLMHINSWEQLRLVQPDKNLDSLFMGAVMALVMRAFMLDRYKNRSVNRAIFAGPSVVVVQ